MPSHWGHKALNIVPGSSATATQVLHAVGGGGSGRRSTSASKRSPIASRGSSSDEIVYTSLGEGATSEGEFWESLNTACTKRLPVLYLIEDNGYAISVPVEVQTPGGDVSRLLRPFPGLHVASVDGTDFFASLRVDARGRRLRARAQGPGAGARARDPAVLALAVRRREAVQDAAGARGRSAARPDHPVCGVPAPQRPGDRRRARVDPRRGRSARSTKPRSRP